MSTVTEKEKHGLTIAARDAVSFDKADKICQHIFDHIGNRLAQKGFRLCDTTWFSHKIIKLISENFANEKGYWIPEGAQAVSITETTNAVTVDTKYEGFLMVIEYKTEYGKMTNKFCSQYMFNPQTINEILNAK